MEAVGTAVGIASLGIEVCQGLLSYHEAWRSYHQDICDTCNKASELERTFALLNNTLKAPDLEPERRARVAECLTSCKTGLDRFQKKYRKLQSVPQPAGIREKAAAAVRRSLYPFKVSTLAKLTEMIEDLVRHLSFAVQILQISLTKDSSSDIAAVGAMTQNLTFQVISLEADLKIWQKDDKYHKVMAWLSAPDPTTSHSAARQRHQTGTGSWLFACDSYISWKRKPGSHLWLNGKAGPGKTVLCSTAIEDLDSYNKNARDVVLAYFYFSFAEVDKQSFDNLLASLVRQLCNNQPPFKRLEEEYDKQYGEVIIVLDALDELPEANERQAVLRHLAELKRSVANVKTVVTSRSMPDIGDAATSYCAVSLPIDLAQANEDIRLYVASQFRQEPRLQSWRSEMQLRLQETFQVKADGMFRRAYCQLESLKELRSARERSIEDALSRLPIDLDTIYERMLARIDPYSLEEALTILRWLSFGASLLTLGELQEARLTCPGEEETVACDDPGSIQDITHILGDLVHIEEPAYVLAQQQHPSSQAPSSRVAWDSFQYYVQEHSNKATNGPAESDREALYEAWLLQDGKLFSNIRLAHFSVKEYLLSGRIPHQLNNDFNLRRTAAREFLALSCLVYLSHYSRSERKQASAADFAAFPLLRHAALYWPAYVHSNMAQPLRHELQFLQDDRARTAWVRVLSSNQGVWDQTQKPKYIYGTALYFASSLGHQACVEWLLKQTAVDVNALAGPYNTVLQAASANGHQTIVDTRFKHGADPNVLRSSDEPFRDRPLYAASEQGHTDIVASLLQAGAEVNHYGSHKGTAIRVAAEKSFDRIVELLLRAGSGVDDADEVHLLTPLTAALDAGHTRVARRLIESEAVVTIADGHGVTALERAAEYGHIALQELMLKIGLGIDWQGAKSSALLAAIRYGYVDGVQILIQHGASVHASREPTFTPLCAACLYAREEIADLLIKTGARVNVGADLETSHSESSKQQSPKSNKKTPGDETESAHDIYINRPWTVRAPPLHRAAWRGYVGVVSLLLRAGAAVDAQRSGSTALQEASYRGHVGVVRLLLEAGADVSADAGEFGTPMQAAIKRGHHDVTRVLETFAMAAGNE